MATITDMLAAAHAEHGKKMAFSFADLTHSELKPTSRACGSPADVRSPSLSAQPAPPAHPRSGLRGALPTAFCDHRRDARNVLALRR